MQAVSATESAFPLLEIGMLTVRRGSKAAHLVTLGISELVNVSPRMLVGTSMV